jgi:hypothetical protein
MSESRHGETLEQQATHATDEARMLLPGVQALLGFQLVAVFNNRFNDLSDFDQRIHLVSVLLVALAMALIMTPAAYHRQVGRGVVTEHFVVLTSRLLTLAMMPFIGGLSIDVYLLTTLIVADAAASIGLAIATATVLAALWFALPRVMRSGG